jgi:hypothetical protein
MGSRGRGRRRYAFGQVCLAQECACQIEIESHSLTQRITQKWYLLGLSIADIIHCV